MKKLGLIVLGFVLLYGCAEEQQQPVGLIASTLHSGDQAITTGVPGQPSVLWLKAGTIEIAPHGQTSATTLNIKGRATASQTVEIYDQGIVKGTAVVGDDGYWTFTLTDLSLGQHSIVVKALYGNGIPDSTVPTFTVQEFVCQTVGIFPDRKNCRKYHICTIDGTGQMKHSAHECVIGNFCAIFGRCGLLCECSTSSDSGHKPLFEGEKSVPNTLFPSRSEQK